MTMLEFLSRAARTWCVAADLAREVTRVVRWNADKRGGTLAIPTADELERGVFYANIDDYRAAHGDVTA
jgi:hypothetical protein